MHQGSVDNIGADFSAAGFPMPDNYNPADWVIDVSEMNEIDDLKKTTFFASEPKGHKIVPKSGEKLEVPDQNRVSILTELKYLLQREFRDIKRNPLMTIINVVITSILAAIFGLMFWDIGRKDRSEFVVSPSTFVLEWKNLKSSRLCSMLDSHIAFGKLFVGLL